MKRESLAAVVALALTACGQIERQEREGQCEREEGWSLYSITLDEEDDFWMEVEQYLDDSAVPDMHLS